MWGKCYICVEEDRFGIIRREETRREWKRRDEERREETRREEKRREEKEREEEIRERKRIEYKKMGRNTTRRKDPSLFFFSMSGECGI